MVNSEREISVGDMIELIKGFIDMLILASGYQSSGLLAHWDSSNIKNAFQWALLLENVLRQLNDSPEHREFVAELDEALAELTTSPTFPQAPSGLSSSSFARARVMLTEHMIHALPLRDEHLKQFMMATTEMDLEELQGNEFDNINLYLDQLMLLSSSLSVVHDVSGSMNVATTLSPVSVENIKIESCISSSNTKLAIKEIVKRQSAVHFLLRAEKGLDIIGASVTRGDLTKGDYGFCEKQQDHAIAARRNELVDYGIWSHWRSKNLSYFLDKRTIRLVSGTSLIFSAPKEQWAQVFKQLNSSSGVDEDVLLETTEMMLLGCISSQWVSTIQSLLSLSNDLLTISKQIQEIYSLLQGRSHSLLEQNTVKSKEKDILTFLIEFVGLGTLVSLLWKISPALVAAAIPSGFYRVECSCCRSSIFRLYLTEIENQLKGKYSTIRCCSCAEDKKEHIDCALGERIWCLHIFHIRRGNSMLIRGTGSI